MHWECGILHRNMKKQEWGTQPRAPDNGNSTSCSGYLAPGTGHWEPYTGHPDLAPTTENWASSTKHWELGTGALPALQMLHPALGIWHQELGLGTRHCAGRHGTQYQELDTQHREFGTGNGASCTGHPALGILQKLPITRNQTLGILHWTLCTRNWAPGNIHPVFALGTGH